MKIVDKIKLLSFVCLLTSACSTTKQATTIDTNIPCLLLHPITYHNVRFNPRWIVENKIEAIIEREYLDGRSGKIHLVTILEYDSEGYLETKYSGLGYPKDDSPNKEDIFSRWEYETEIMDSFVIQSSKIVRFHNENGKMEKPDTLHGGRIINNVGNAVEFGAENGDLKRSYQYDESNRLVAEKDDDGENRYSITYHDDGRIEISKFSRWQNSQFSSWVTLDRFGRIAKNVDESNNSTHEFKYNDLGRLIEDKHWFKGKEPNYHTYEYISEDSR